MKLHNFVLLLLLLFVMACGAHIPRKYAKYATIKYDKANLDMKLPISTTGTFVLSKKTGKYAELKIYLIFYPDGTYAETTDFEAIVYYNSINGRCGAYLINGDTIKIQSYGYKMLMTPYDGREEWFLIKDNNTLEFLHFRPMKEEMIQFLDYKYSLAHFVYKDTLPDCNCWVKKYNWMWENRDDWKVFMNQKKKQ